MCGIFCISYGADGPEAEEWSPSEMLSMMFPAIVHRGPHAYGWMYFDGEQVVSQKFVGRSDTKAAQKNMVVPDNIKWIVGHVRYATHGSPEVLLNNHPIKHGEILGVHNGVIRNHQSILAQTGREDVKTEVDSEAIFAAVNKWGHLPGLRRIQGDMVTIYTNLNKPSMLYIGRTVGRPFETARTPGGAFIGASEGGVIDSTGINHTTFSSVRTNRLLRIRDGKILARADIVAPERYSRESWYPGTVVPRGEDKGMAELRRVRLEAADKAEEEARQVAKRALKPAQGPNKALESLAPPKPFPAPQNAAGPVAGRNMKDGDHWNGFVMYQGRLLTEEKYEEAMDFDRFINGWGNTISPITNAEAE